MYALPSLLLACSHGQGVQKWVYWFMPVTVWQEQMGVWEFQFSWWTVLNLAWLCCYYMWDTFDATKTLLKYCGRWSRTSFVGNNNRMRLFRLKWINIWKNPLLIIRSCLREADWCCLYQMVCRMRLSLSAPVDTPDGEAAWGKNVRVQPGEDTCGHWVTSLGKAQSGLSVRAAGRKRSFGKDIKLHRFELWQGLSVVALSSGPVPSWCQAWGCLTCFSRAVGSCWHQKHEALAVFCWHLSYKIDSNNEW